VKEPLQSQIERIKPAIEAFAEVGWRAWPKPDSDVNTLLTLPAVQTELEASRAEGLDLDANGRNDVVAGVIETAIKRLPDRYANTALAQFGFSLREGDKESRREKAASHFGVAAGSYRQPLVMTLNMKPWDYMNELVTCAVCAVPDPVAFVAGRDNEDTATDATAVIDAPAGQLSVTHRFRPRTAMGIATSVVIVACVTLVIALGGHAVRPQTSTVVVGGPTKPRRGHRGISPSLDEPRFVAVLEACTLVAGCQKGSHRHPVVADLDEPVNVRINLDSSFIEPIATVRLLASTTQEGEQVIVTVVTSWTIPTPPDAVESHTSTVAVAPYIDVDGDRADFLPHLEYIPGSAQFYYTLATNPEREATKPTVDLPNDLFTSSGITLKQVGPQRSCAVTCRQARIASVHFAMRAKGIRLTN
jgi:hypothetical protein